MKMENYKGSTGFCVGRSVTCKLFALEGGGKGAHQEMDWTLVLEGRVASFFLSSYL
jgi:hypothetical protein